MKKNDKKSPKRAAKKGSNPPKITLPAFGLAEDILGQQDIVVSGVAAGDDLHAAALEPADSGPGLLNKDQTRRELNAELHLVTFHLDDEEYGVTIGRVQEIIRVGQITGVPNAPEFIRGVINLRGRIIPVLDLRKRLSLAEAPMTKHSRIIVVEAGTKVLGLLVDRVSQVIRLPHASVDLPPDEIEESRGFVRGIGKIDSRLIMIMELDRVLAKDARQAAALQHQD